MSKKIIFTFYHDKYKMAPKMMENWESIKKTHPEFDCKLFDIIDAIEFLQCNFKHEVLDAFMELKPYSYKSDLFRYAYIYLHGGIYIDIKYSLQNDFRFHSFIDDNTNYYVREPFGIQTCLLISNPFNNIFLYCINKIVQHVKKQWYGINALGITGPLLISYIYFHYFVENYENNLHTEYYKTFEEEPLYILNRNICIHDKNIINNKNTNNHHDMIWKVENNYQQIFFKDKLILQEYSEYRNDLQYNNNTQKHYMEQYKKNDIYKKIE